MAAPFQAHPGRCYGVGRDRTGRGGRGMTSAAEHSGEPIGKRESQGGGATPRPALGTSESEAQDTLQFSNEHHQTDCGADGQGTTVSARCRHYRLNPSIRFQPKSDFSSPDHGEDSHNARELESGAVGGALMQRAARSARPTAPGLSKGHNAPEEISDCRVEIWKGAHLVQIRTPSVSQSPPKAERGKVSEFFAKVVRG